MIARFLSLVVFILTSQADTEALVFNGQPQFTLKGEKNRAFHKSCLIGTFRIKDGNIADCLEHCVEDCRCQSFQICQNTKCELCSSHKEENSSLLHDQDGCVYATYEIQHLFETIQNGEHRWPKCSGVSHYMKYNCCHVSGICPENKLCRPTKSLEKPWKRFMCRCPKYHHRDKCNERPTIPTGGRRTRRARGVGGRNWRYRQRRYRQRRYRQRQMW